MAPKGHVKQVAAHVTAERKSGGALGRKKKRGQRQRLRKAKRAYHDAEDKAKRVVRDFHYKTAHYLLQRYHTVLLPHTSAHLQAMRCLRHAERQAR